MGNICINFTWTTSVGTTLFQLPSAVTQTHYIHTAYISYHTYRPRLHKSYGKTSNINRTQSQNWNVFLLSYSCFRAIHWIQMWSREWICCWGSADRRCSIYIWMISKFIAYLDATYIRGLVVFYVNHETHSHTYWIAGKYITPAQCTFGCNTSHSKYKHNTQ